MFHFGHEFAGAALRNCETMDPVSGLGQTRRAGETSQRRIETYLFKAPSGTRHL